MFWKLENKGKELIKKSMKKVLCPMPCTNRGPDSDLLPRRGVGRHFFVLLKWNPPYAFLSHRWLLPPAPPGSTGAIVLPRVFSSHWIQPAAFFPPNTTLSRASSIWKTLIKFWGKWWQKKAQKATH